MQQQQISPVILWVLGQYKLAVPPFSAVRDKRPSSMHEFHAMMKAENVQYVQDQASPTSPLENIVHLTEGEGGHWVDSGLLFSGSLPSPIYRRKSRLMEEASNYHQQRWVPTRSNSHYSLRESLLAEAWERKRIHYRQLQEELKIEGDDGEAKEECKKEDGNEDEAEQCALVGNVDVRDTEGSWSTEEISMTSQSGFKGRSTSASECVLHHCNQVQKTKNNNGRKIVRLRDDDFEELRGCIDLGLIGASGLIGENDDDEAISNHSGCSDQNSMEELCETLPALHVYRAVASNLHRSPANGGNYRRDRDYRRQCSTADTHVKVANGAADDNEGRRCPAASAVSCWTISTTGDDPRTIKTKLRLWAQAVACDMWAL